MEYSLKAILINMKWDVEYTDDFGEWWACLSEDEQESLDASVRLLEDRGPHLGFPHSSGINGQDTAICVNCALSTTVDRFEPCTRLTHGGQPSC